MVVGRSRRRKRCWGRMVRARVEGDGNGSRRQAGEVSDLEGSTVVMFDEIPGLGWEVFFSGVFVDVGDGAVDVFGGV